MWADRAGRCGQIAHLAEAVLILLREVEVLVTLGLVVGVVPRHLEVRLELLGEADARARVAREVEAGDAGATGILGDGIEEVILLDAKRSGLDRAVVGDDDQRAALWVLGGLEGGRPADHAHIVGAHDARAGGEDAVVIEKQLIDLEEGRGDGGGTAVGNGGLPVGDESLLDEAEEVVGVRGADAAGDGALGGEGRRDRVGLDKAGLLVAGGAVRLGGARHRVQVLDVTAGLEPLAGHGRGDEADGLARAVGVGGMGAHLDLVDGELEEARRVARDQGGHELVPLVDDRLGVHIGKGREDVHEEVRRRRGRDRLVEDGELELVECLLHRRLGHRCLVETRRVGDAAHEDALLHARLDTLGAEKDDRVMRDGRQAFGLPVLEALELEEVVHRRVHVATGGHLRVARREREGELARQLGRVGDHERDEADALGLELRLERGESLSGRLDELLLGVGTVGDAGREGDVEDVVGRGALALERVDDGAEAGEVGHVRHNAVALGVLGTLLGDVGGLVLELADGGAAGGRRGHLLDVVRLVPALDGDLHRGEADIGVAEEGEKGVGHNRAGSRGRVDARLCELRLELLDGLVEWLLGLHEAKLGGGEGHLLVRVARQLRERDDNVEGRGEVAEGRDAEALGEDRQLAEEGVAQFGAEAELLVSEGGLVDGREVVGVGLDEGSDARVRRDVNKGVLDGEVAREDGADNIDRVLAQAGGELVDGRGHRGKGRVDALALGLELGAHVRVNRGGEGDAQGGDLL